MPAAFPHVEIAHYPDAATGLDRVLVVLAMGVPCWLMPAGTGFSLMVEEPEADAAREQLRRYEAESRGWPPPDPHRSRRPRPVPPAARFTALLWALAEIAAFWAESQSGGAWLRAGALDPAAVFGRGQVWRAFTALFLHADAGHLLSNLAAGYFVFCGALAEFGVRRGWALIALTAVAGNLAAAAVHAAGGVVSIGASTAVFSALGLLCGRAAADAWAGTDRIDSRALILPLGAGLALLALYGSGGPGVPVDLEAHLFGFAAGAAAGTIRRANT
ncbi:MAG TPA: rhomboid family intramembrane serine protease [Opitutaceae bacterium]|jgi:membrane associated rhomboid family serine protease|nr:rhomboid family intramembrane serine protease [Opitutaceae bacterium]